MTMNYGYNQIPNPIMQYQQRLAQMEQQFPQFSQQPMQQSLQQQSLRATLVTNIQEAQASQIPLDGSITVFVNSASNEVYSKRVGKDGLPEFKTYKGDEPPTKEVEENPLESRIKALEEKIEQFEKPDAKYPINKKKEAKSSSYETGSNND